MIISTNIDEVFAFMEPANLCERANINFAIGFSDENGMFCAGAFEIGANTMVPVNGVLLPEYAWQNGYILPGRSWTLAILRTIYQEVFSRYAKVCGSTSVENADAISFNERAGMTIESTQYDLDGAPQFHTYSMTREQCVFLNED